MKPVEVRGQLVEALRLDLVGPDNGSDLEAKVLTQAPSRWYLPHLHQSLVPGLERLAARAGRQTRRARRKVHARTVILRVIHPFKTTSSALHRPT